MEIAKIISKIRIMHLYYEDVAPTRCDFLDELEDFFLGFSDSENFEIGEIHLQGHYSHRLMRTTLHSIDLTIKGKRIDCKNLKVKKLK